MRLASLLAITAFAALSTAPANAVCFERDKSKPYGWNLDLSVGPRTFPVEDEFKRSFMVVIGKVVSVQNILDHEEPDFIEAMKYRVIVSETYKGPILPEFTIYSLNDSGRALVDPGKAYVLFVDAQDGRSSVDNCGWSDELARSQDTLAKLKTLAATSQPPPHT